MSPPAAPAPRDIIAIVIRPYIAGNFQDRARLAADAVLDHLAFHGYVLVAASAVAEDAERFGTIEARLEVLAKAIGEGNNCMDHHTHDEDGRVRYVH